MGSDDPGTDRLESRGVTVSGALPTKAARGMGTDDGFLSTFRVRDRAKAIPGDPDEPSG